MKGPEADLAVYHAPTPNGWKVTICLEEMGLPYRLIPVRLGSDPPEGFHTASPNGKIPALIDAMRQQALSLKDKDRLFGRSKTNEN